MATSQETAAFILHQLGRPERFSTKPMVGEFAIFADGKTVGFICDDQLLVKLLLESAVLEGHCERAPAYPGSKDYYLVTEELIPGAPPLAGLLMNLEEALPLPKASGKKRKT